MQIFCPCNSGLDYNDCCQPFHDNKLPDSALALMRSRYSAYALNNPEYIIRTTHPNHPNYKKNHNQWVQEISDFCLNTQFQKLEILEVIEGFNESFVTFNAYLLQNNKKIQLTEKSQFLKIKKQWLYRDAIAFNIQEISDSF